MGVFEKLNRNPKLGFGVGAAIIIIGLGIVALQVSPGKNVVAPKHAFYTDDDGKTYFRDDIKKFLPFDHQGKQAFRADVFKCEQGHEFVGLIFRMTDIGRRQMEDYLATKPKDPEGALLQGIEHRGMQVKKAGANDKAWALNDEHYTESLRAKMKCPQGHPALLVAP